jgi:tetratricopeptide (TPR) repeat protein
MPDFSPDEETTKSPPPMVGRYRLERQLGRGGMGSVHLAKDTLLHRRVALKRLFAGTASDPEVRKRILVEAQKAGRMNNPHIAAVYDVFEDQDELVLVMEYVEGRTLRQHMQERPPRLEEFWDIADQCLEALESAHREGIIHRDLKPDNVMITAEGQIKLLDFGLARQVPQEDATTLTTTPSEERGLRGTPPYMPPEALLGLSPDARGDVFSLGVTFYELLAGRRPFDGVDRAETYRKILKEPPPSIQESNPEVSPDLEMVIAGMLAKDPEARYPGMTEVREAVLAVRRGDAVPLPAPLPEYKPAAGGGARHRRLVYLLLGVAVLGSGIILRHEWPKIQGAPLPADRNLAVLPPVVKGGKGSFPAFALGVAAVLGTDLAPAARAARLPLDRVTDLLKEDAGTATEARARLGADLALTTELVPGDTRLDVRQELIETKTGQVLRVKQQRLANTASPLLLLEVLSADARKMLDLPPPVKRSRKERFGTEGDGSMQYYLEGLGRLAAAKTTEDLDAATHSFELAMNIDPTFARVRAGMGAVCYARYLRDKNTSWLEQAKTEAKAGLALDPDLAEAHKLLGYASYRLGDAAGAKRFLERTVQLDPDDFAAFREWARVYGREGDPDSEEVIYRRAIAASAYDWRPHLWLATQLYVRGKFDESRKSLETVVRLAPDNYLGYSYLGGVFVLQGKYQEAIKNLDRSIALNPTPEAVSNLGTAYFNLRRMSDAILTYNRSFQFGIENYLLWINLGDAYRWSPGQEQQADKAYRKAIELGRKELEEKPYHDEVRAQLAPILARQSEADTARAWIARALEHAADNPNIQYCAALTYWELGQPDQALDRLEKAVGGGYPKTWLRDSAVFDAWRSSPRFQAIVGGTAPAADTSISPARGGS